MPRPTFTQLAEEKRERILKNAAALFAEKGFTRADVAQLASSAGVAKGSLYNYFDNKEDLYRFACREGLRRFRQAIYGAIEPEWDVFRQVEHFFSEGAAFAREHPDFIKLFINISSAGQEEFAEDLAPDAEKYFADHFKALIKKGVRAGLVRRDLDPALAAFVINSLYVACLASLVNRYFQIRMEEYLEIPVSITDASEGSPAGFRRVVDLIHGFLRPYPVQGD
ncbi:MAG: TetR/AcrR family transcriptional regulator [Pseudomonadota bacterium]